MLCSFSHSSLPYDELAKVMAAEIVVENALPLLQIPPALDAQMPPELARLLVKALRRELGVAKRLLAHELGVHLTYEELAVMLGDVRDDRPPVLDTVQRISARLSISGADYLVLDLDPKIEETALGRRILRRLPMLAAALAAHHVDLGRLMLVVRAGSLAPYARILDIARIHFRALACPGMPPDALDAVSPGSSAAHLV